MREGKPCGFMMMSGQTPRSEKGRSSCCTMRPMTPFCPWRDENLSPSSGRRVERMRILIRCESFLLPETITRSTYVFSWPTGPLYERGLGRYAEGGSESASWLLISERVSMGVCLLTSTSPWFSRSPTPQMPSSSRMRKRWCCTARGALCGLAAAGLAMSGGGIAISAEPLANFLRGQENFLSTMHRPSPRSSAALLRMSASSMS
mmetsp:Transcript_43054/g.100899  ORF Transcript_43054/g.100899 Transcript_43054/m.100899 type:complete len:205 (+) Transcript_43054:618-1232(+)